MNQKQIGYIVIALAILVTAFVYNWHQHENQYIMNYIDDQGTCYLDDGTCLHERASTTYILGGIAAGGLLILGLYLIFFDKTQEKLIEQNEKVSQALAEAKRHEREKDEFSAYVAGFSEDEQKVLKAVHEQDGILQATLRYRTDFSKASLSLLLKDLEERHVIARKPEGKTNKVFLVKKF